MKLSGSFEINLSKHSVWEALNNPEILRKSIPGCEEFKKIPILALRLLQQIKLGLLMQLLPEI